MSLIIWDIVKTPAGEGILTSVTTPGNGLYIEYDNAKCSVYYKSNGGIWISGEWNYKEILQLNKDLVRDNKLNKLI
jgi:hypothetical protein